MFRYYQTSEKTEWKPIKECSSVTAEAIKNGAIKLTVLALSEEITEDTEKAEVKYKGPFYADIDNKEDVSGAAQSVLLLRESLLSRDIEDSQIQLFASGSKGFHVIVHEKNFSSGRAIKLLPKVYQEMALQLYVPGLDMQVYSMGKGVSWRLPNIKRENGKYRVTVTVDEVLKIVTGGREAYDVLVSKPK